MITFKQFYLKETFEYSLDKNPQGETPRKEDVTSKDIIRFKRDGKVVGMVYGNLQGDKFQIEFADVKESGPEEEKGGFFGALLRQLMRKFTVVSDETNTSAFQELGAVEKDGRYVLQKK